MDASTLAAFALAFSVFAGSPGPDNMTIVARTLAQGAAAGIVYGAGTVTGILLFLVLAAFGLSVVASEMGIVMAILRYAGAAYLVVVGIRLWRSTPIVPDEIPVNRSGLAPTFAAGLVLNLGNPKMPLFYVALLPNVVGANLTVAQVASLGLVIITVEIVVIGSHVLLANRARTVLRTPRVVRRVNRTAGAAMVGSGVAVVVTR